MRLTLDVSGAVAQLKAERAAWGRAVPAFMDAAGNRIEAMFRDEWLSGRRGDDTGLNVITGNLRGSLFHTTTQKPDGVELELGNRGAMYWFYHDIDGNSDRHPVRLRMAPLFVEYGERVILEEGEAALGRVFA